MRILDENGVEVLNPDFGKGYYVEDQIVKEHHPAREYIPEQFHYEVVREYPNGGKDVEKVIDFPGQEACDAWDEYEDILRWYWYGEDDDRRPKVEMIAEKDYPKGTYFTIGDRLFIATIGIPNHTSVVVGVNCEETSLADALNKINS